MTATTEVKSYSLLANPVAGDTGTGLDQLVALINSDLGLAGANVGPDIAGGAAAANSLNQLIIDAAIAVNALGGGDRVFTVSDVAAINAWIRDAAHPERYEAFVALHGDDENGSETGFHLVQNDGATTKYRGQNAIDTVADGIYHIGFAIENGRFLNEDGDANASVEQVAAWLTQFFTDHSTTGGGLDRIPDLVMADSGLARAISEADIEGGADAADGIDRLIDDAIAATGVASDNWISAADVQAINAWIREDSGRYQLFVTLHGDDENGSETGFHLVQNDGASTRMFGENFVNTVADGIYHIGFAIEDGRFENEDGDANATVGDVADWINYFHTDQSTTGTGLDRIVDAIKLDRGLARETKAGDINGGAEAADDLNALIVDAITATNAMADGWLTGEDMVAVNAWIRADSGRYALFVALHGDDENGSETGFHLVQNDGASSQLFGQNLINTVVDGIYHIGFDIEDGRFVNEDGDANATIEDVATWLNYFYGAKTIVLGTEGGDAIAGSELGEEFDAKGGDDTINAGGGDDLVLAGWGCDTVNGGAGIDIVYGGFGDDKLDGGNDGDVFRVAGNLEEGWCSFQGYDTYNDTGTGGTDAIAALGDGDVDIGLTGFKSTNGIEVVDGTGATGTVRLLGDWKANVLDFRGATLVGGNIVVDGGDGNDTIYAAKGGATIVGGRGDDKLNGEVGDDTFVVTGNEAGGWESFQGYDTYADVGGTDTIAALGDGDVDIGLTGFKSTNGIEVVDGTGATGTVRLLGDWKANVLDFRGATLVGGNIVVDGGDGNDTIYAAKGGATIVGGRGDDKLNGEVGDDTFVVTGNEAGGWESFQGYDTYADVGGTDTIAALGDGDVDIGLTGFKSTNGIEMVDGTGATGTVRLLGDWKANVLDFRGATLVGGNIVVDGGDGNDTIYAAKGGATIVGGRGDDKLNGEVGDDTFVVTGNEAGGWESFQGYDTYADVGGTDTIAALGDGDVDIGLTGFKSTNGIEVVDGTGATGTVRLLGDWKANVLDFRGATLVGGNIVVDGGDGNDTIYAAKGGATIVGGRGDDKLNGEVGDDTFVVTGNEAGGWESFQGYDTYADVGGTDTIAALGDGDVDIGLTGFKSTNGIEVVDGTGATGTVRLLGDWKANVLDFRGATLVGGNIVVDGGDGNDTIYAAKGGATIVGGRGDDKLNGEVGDDTFVVTGNEAGGWESFQGYDTYADVGGTDTIAALGDGDVDIGLTGFKSTNGIEVVDGTGATGTVRLLGDWKANVLDFRGATLVGGNIVVDGGDGNDTIYAAKGGATIVGGRGDDKLNGEVGDDTFVVTGNEAGGWESFQGYDTYADVGGTDTIAALGDGDVDIGLTGFKSTNGIEMVDGTGATGTVRLLGDWKANVLDFRGATLVGGNIVVDGGDGNDTILGTSGGDIISGGRGNDSLTGSGGGDVFRFDEALDAWGNVDTVTDFVAGSDTFELSLVVFDGLAGMAELGSDAFAVGSAAADDTDRIIYDSVTGRIFYDEDGTGAAMQVLFAKVTAQSALNASDFRLADGLLLV